MAIINILKKIRAGTVFIRQILTYKDGPRSDSVNLTYILTTINPGHQGYIYLCSNCQFISVDLLLLFSDNKCTTDLCKNGGSCVLVGTAPDTLASCDCAPGYMGSTCDTGKTLYYKQHGWKTNIAV